MLHIDIPGYGSFDLQTLVLDFNGTIGLDGSPVAGVQDRILQLSQVLDVVVLSADTYDTVAKQLEGFACRVVLLDPTSDRPEDEQKLDAVEALGPETLAFAGNGRNDRLALEQSALGVVVAGPEGAAVSSLLAADVVVPDALACLDLLLQPKRLIATLRS